NRDASAPAHRAICPPGDDRRGGRLGRPATVRKPDIAAGGASRDAWNQTNRDALSRFAIWPSHLAQESGVYRRRRLIARVGHRREPCDLQFCGFVFPEAPPRGAAETSN